MVDGFGVNLHFIVENRALSASVLKKVRILRCPL